MHATLHVDEFRAVPDGDVVDGAALARQQRRDPALHAALRACARGTCPAEADIDRPYILALPEDFAFVRTGISITHDATQLAEINWPTTITALAVGELPCSGGEQRMLWLASSRRNPYQPPRHADQPRRPQHPAGDRSYPPRVRANNHEPAIS
jgi:hypothetical protein